MKAIFKKEIQAYFKTPIGYVFIGIFLLYASLSFIGGTLLAGMPTVDSILYSLVFIITFIIPVLTMRLISEEKNKKTDQVLLTSPLSTVAIVMGKFLAACAVYFIALLLTLLYLVVIAFHGNVLVMQTLCSYIGFIFLGISLISIGIFISSLTENQIVSAIVSLIVFIVIINLIDPLNDMISNSVISTIFSALSIMTRFEEFNAGVLSLSGVVYFVSIIAVFLALTCHTLESRRFK